MWDRETETGVRGKQGPHPTGSAERLYVPMLR